MLRKTILILFASCLLYAPKTYCEEFECDYIACEISQMIYDEYLESLKKYEESTDYIYDIYLKGYSDACLHLIYRINLID